MAEKHVSVDDPRLDPADRIDEFLREGGGSIHAIGNYLAVPDTFEWVPNAHRKANIARMLVLIEDDANFGASAYGGIVGGLVNGVRIVVRDSLNGDALVAELDGGEPVYTNTDWAGLCHDFTPFVFGTGQNNQVGTVRWTFARATAPLFLDGAKGHYLSVELNDDLSTLVDHRFLVQGKYL